MVFGVFKLFSLDDIKNDFKKLKKYYFDLFLNRKYFKKQRQILFKISTKIQAITN